MWDTHTHTQQAYYLIITPPRIRQKHDLSTFSRHLSCSGNKTPDYQDLFICFTQVSKFLEVKVAVVIDGYKWCWECVTSVWHRLLTAVSGAPGGDVCLLAFRTAAHTFSDEPIPVLTCRTLGGHQHQRCLHDKRSLKLVFVFLQVSVWSTQSMCC